MVVAWMWNILENCKLYPVNCTFWSFFGQFEVIEPEAKNYSFMNSIKRYMIPCEYNMISKNINHANS